MKTIFAKDFTRSIVYYPKKRPGFVAWATAFDYGNGKIGLSFKETLQEESKSYLPPPLEMGEAVGAPVSYCSVECGSEHQESYRVYMVSSDNGKSFEETGRCQLEQGSFCNAGFPDGRIIGFDVPRINDDGTGWCDYIEVRESLDGGTSWSPISRILEGTAPYLWRLRRLKDGTILLLASLYGTPWGLGRERSTRNTMLPGESYLSKIQTFFMTTHDGKTFSEPHYILPGIGAHEYDVAELNDGRLLFIAGDVQATPVARQFVTPSKSGWINGAIQGIKKGAPPSPQTNPQGGFVPESIVLTSDGLLVGSRRGKPYSCSNDLGENWFKIESEENSLYQPFLLSLPDGRLANFGHYGGDNAFGQEDMYVGVDIFSVPNTLPISPKISLSRMLSNDKDHYENRFLAVLSAGGKPIEGQEVVFRFNPYWLPDGTASTLSQSDAPIKVKAVTNKSGEAIGSYDFPNGDIHFAYTVDVVFAPDEKSEFSPCEGPLICALAMTPRRKNRYPFDAYFAGGTLYLSPQLLSDFPNLTELLLPLCKKPDAIIPKDALPKEITDRLISCGVLLNDKSKNELKWLNSIHSPYPLLEISDMGEGDWYV